MDYTETDLYKKAGTLLDELYNIKDRKDFELQDTETKRDLYKAIDQFKVFMDNINIVEVINNG